MDPLPTFGFVCFKEESLHVFNNGVQSAKLLLLDKKKVKHVPIRRMNRRLTSLIITKSSSDIDFSINLICGPTMRDRGCLDAGTNASRLLDEPGDLGAQLEARFLGSMRTRDWFVRQSKFLLLWNHQRRRCRPMFP